MVLESYIKRDWFNGKISWSMGGWALRKDHPTSKHRHYQPTP